MFFGLLKLLEDRLDQPYAYPKSAWVLSAMERDSSGQFTSKLFDGRLGQKGVTAATPTALVQAVERSKTVAAAGWVRYYSDAKMLKHLHLFRKQVETHQPDVAFVGVPGIHDLIRSRDPGDPVRLANQLGELVEKLKMSSPATRVIYLSINVQDESKKQRQYANQGREWSVQFIRTVSDTLRNMDVEVLDTSSFTDVHAHGNVLSSDGTHVWGFVDVMKARLALAAVCRSS